MPRPAIPEREPVRDLFPGAVVQAGERQALYIGPAAEFTLLPGPCLLRYGVRYLGKPHLSIVPGLLALDYGEMLTGEAAWDFLMRHSNRYPRAEVFGYRNDGRDESMLVRGLDVALAPEVLVYADEHAATPAARPTALIAPDDAPELPGRLLSTLARFAALEDWLSQPTP